MKFTEAEAMDIINRANDTSYKSFEELNLKVLPSSQNELLNQMQEKITKMFVVDTYTAKLREIFTNSFANANQKLEIGAISEIVDTALLETTPDTINVATDLLPKLDAQPAQYIQHLFRNVKERIELTINESIFKRAFTNINAFNSFMTLVVKRLSDGQDKYMFGFVIQQIFLSVFNGKKSAKTSLIDFIKDIYNEFGSYAPYTTQLNLGANPGATTLNPATTTSPINVGTDAIGDPLPIKTNSWDMTIADGKSKFPRMVILTNGAIRTQVLNILAEIYHDTSLSIENRFAKIIDIPKDIYDAQIAKLQAATGDNTINTLFYAIDERALVILWNLEASKAQFWNKGEGQGLRNIVNSFWANVGVIPWMNGGYWYGNIQQPSPVSQDQLTYYSEVQAVSTNFNLDANAIVAAADANIAPILQTALRATVLPKTVADWSNAVVIFTNPPSAATVTAPTEATYSVYVPVIQGKNATAPMQLSSAFKYKNATK